MSAGSRGPGCVYDPAISMSISARFVFNVGETYRTVQCFVTICYKQVRDYTNVLIPSNTLSYNLWVGYSLQSEG